MYLFFYCLLVVDGVMRAGTGHTSGFLEGCVGCLGVIYEVHNHICVLICLAVAAADSVLKCCPPPPLPAVLVILRLQLHTSMIAPLI